VTTAPAPTIAPRPIVTPGRIVAFAPIEASRETSVVANRPGHWRLRGNGSHDPSRWDNRRIAWYYGLQGVRVSGEVQ
jgi:hypothetical protein